MNQEANPVTPDEIFRYIDLKATPEVVWAAISDSQKFGQWFRCAVGGPYVVGQVNNCRSTYGGGEAALWQKRIRAMEPARYFAYSWSPGVEGRGAHQLNDEVGETLVEFTLQATAEGTHLTIRESGFRSLPHGVGELSHRRNTQGGDAQVENISAYIHA